MKNNPQRRTAWIWVAITLISVAAIFAPSIIGIDGMNGGFAISFTAIVFAITSVVVAVMYFRRAQAVDSIVKGDKLLAHWVYTPEEWQRYTEEEFARDKSAKTILFFTIAVITAVVGVGFYLYKRDHPMVIFLTCVGIIGVSALAAFASIITARLQNNTSHAEAYISRDGVYLARQFHTWQGMGARFENASYLEGASSLPLIEFAYSVPGRNMRYDASVRIPVPPGKEDHARKIVLDIIAAHPSPDC